MKQKKQPISSNILDEEQKKQVVQTIYELATGQCVSEKIVNGKKKKIKLPPNMQAVKELLKICPDIVESTNSGDLIAALQKERGNASNN